MRVALLLLITACYREQAVTPPTNVASPLAIAKGRLVCNPDDADVLIVDASPDLRLRTQSDGPLTKWQPPPAPAGIPTSVDGLDLLLLDNADGGHLAFYRNPYNRQSCALSGATNCAYEARFYDKTGRMRWRLGFEELLSRKTHLEIQDIRLAGGVLYFNEACQGYSREAKGACSSLVAVDPIERRVLWRTRPLVSNGRFMLNGCYVVAGYGFTDEPDALHVVDRASGRIIARTTVESAPQHYEIAGEQLLVELHSGARRRYRVHGFDGPNPTLEESSFGGAGYGGVGYGGTHGNP